MYLQYIHTHTCTYYIYVHVLIVYTHTHTHTHMYILYICTCTCSIYIHICTFIHVHTLHIQMNKGMIHGAEVWIEFASEENGFIELPPDAVYKPWNRIGVLVVFTINIIMYVY